MSAILSSAGDQDGVYELGVAFYLRGPHSNRFHAPRQVNRSVHFAGGRMRARIKQLQDRYSVSLWLWNGMPNDARDITDHLINYLKTLTRNHSHGIYKNSSSEPGLRRCA